MPAAPTNNAVNVGVAQVATLAGANPQRTHLVVRNRDAANPVWLGGPTVAAGTGLDLLAGQTLVLDDWTGPLYAIASGGSVDVRVMEGVGP